MTIASRLAAATLAALMCWTATASAQQAPPPQYPPPRREPGPATYGPDELVTAGHKFFGNVSRGLASIIERAVSQWGLPNGYILGEEGSGAFVAGLRYGEGTLYTKHAGDECDLSALRRTRRLGLYHRRLRHDRADRQQHRAGADPLRHRAAARRQCRLSQIYPARDLEPVLSSSSGRDAHLPRRIQVNAALDWRR